MFSQYSVRDSQAPLKIVQVKCEKTGTIWYKKGAEIAWTKEELMIPKKTSKDQYKR